MSFPGGCISDYSLPIAVLCVFDVFLRLFSIAGAYMTGLNGSPRSSEGDHSGRWRRRASHFIGRD